MNADNQPPRSPTIVSRALIKALRPLVAAMLRFELTYPRVIALLKELYVEAAEIELAGSKRVSDSRITLITGVHRKDVARLRAAGTSSEEFAPSAKHASLGAQLVAEWMANPRFHATDNPGNPAALPLRATPSNGAQQPSFTELVELICRQDMRPRAVLDEWQRLEIVTVEDSLIRLNTAAFAPKSGVEEKAYFFGRNIQDHIAAGTSNLQGDAPPFFDRSVYYDGLSDRSIGELDALCAELASNVLNTVNTRAYTLQQADKKEITAEEFAEECAEECAQKPNEKSERYRFNLGIFNYYARETKEHTNG